MHPNHQLVKLIKSFYQKNHKQSTLEIREQRSWLMRTFLVTRKQADWVNAGFVLPTVAMVTLVVILLTTAILFRSFKRAENASNVRVNQSVLNAVMPSIDRAKAKINQLFNDPTLPRSTPSDGSLYDAFTKNLTKYTFGDETPLEVSYNLDSKSGINDKDDTELENREAINTAWRFPVDTDNNGKYDSLTLYGVFFRSPSRGDDAKFDRARTPLDARARPMGAGKSCGGAAGTSASLVSGSGWYRLDGTLKKSFFVYSTTVPIDDTYLKNAKLTTTKYEAYKGNKGFSAIEFQQDQERIPLSNNAVVYEDDLEITPGAGLSLNGRIFTNSNLLTAKIYNDIQFYQVSDPDSCFYTAQNSKVVVGGNVGFGRITGGSTRGGVKVDLFRPGNKPSQAQIDNNNKTANNSSADIAFNTQAYAQRINSLVEKQISKSSTQDPSQVKNNVNTRLEDNPGLDQNQVRREELESYFKQRTRKVTFKKVKLGADPGTAQLQDSGDLLRPQDRWIYPTNTNTGLSLLLKKLPATEPNKLKEEYREEEKLLGDRILVGNNLPALWFDQTIKDFVGSDTPQSVDYPNKANTKWDDYSDEKDKYRTRSTKIEQLVSLAGATDRDGFFEEKATEKPKDLLDNIGGVRIVTGAGIYVDDVTYKRVDKSFLPEPQWDTNFVDPKNADTKRIKANSLKFKGKDPIIVWSDSMPMTGGSSETRQGDLLMRATAVYHYAKDYGQDQEPIACVSSYYDPTNSVTAQNNSKVRARWKNPDADSGTTQGRSNNGIVYTFGGRTKYATELERQARMVFPDGRFVNEPLRKALEKSSTKRTAADYSAIDTAICALDILKGKSPSSSPVIPHGAIYEAAFLDARQVKSIDIKSNLAELEEDYTRSIEQRQPLEVRVSVLDIDKMRQKKVSGTNSGGGKQEYLIPNSGIIYATRDDALPDLSETPDNNIEQRKLISPTDYKLDPSRRPNGIMLINGSRLDRDLKFRQEEKGLILASNLPTYIKGDFNLHAKSGNASSPVEEFTDQLRDDKTGAINWSRFYNRNKTLDNNFACRKGDKRLPSCTTGDSWRAASVVADAVTVLSDNFRLGFRNEGDYDLRNNAGTAVIPNFDFNGDGDATDTLNETTLKIDLNSDGDTKDSVKEQDQISITAVRLKQGFFDNSFTTSSPWYNTAGSSQGLPKDFDSSTTGIQGSSYVNNFVTPIQRRVQFNEYLMETCTKLPVYTCTADDWSVDGTAISAGGTTATSRIGQKYNKTTTDLAGTTTDLAGNSQLQIYARRVAFARDATTGNLILDNQGHPVPLGIDASGNIQAFPKNAVTGQTWTANQLPRIRQNALWFRTTNSLPNKKIPTDTNYGNTKALFYKSINGNPLTGTDPNEQPLLVPVLQIQLPRDRWTNGGGNPGGDRAKLPQDKDRGIATDGNWLQQATDTTNNLIIAGGDTPGRPSESNGGLENFVRYLETWDTTNHSLSGSLIQYKRSAYATGPWQVVQLNGKTPKGSTALFGSDYRQAYRNSNTGTGLVGEGMTPFYTPPSRQWGFDVGLLSQLPDLFTETFTLPPSGDPNEFFREVGRDDEWVKTLLCAQTIKVTVNSSTGSSTTSRTGKAIPDSQRPQDFCKQYTRS